MRGVNNNPNAPHQAVISVIIEVMERLPDGKVTGLPVSRTARLYTVTGKNLEECQKEVTRFMEKFNG
jgi:hypothetical protein